MTERRGRAKGWGSGCERDKFPCYVDGVHCTKRYPGCHDKCPEFAEAIAKSRARKEIERKQRDTRRAVDAFYVDQVSRATRKKKPER